MPVGTRYKLYTVPVSAAQNGTRELIAAPGAAKHIAIFGGSLTGDAAGTATFKSGTDALTGAVNFAANGHLSIPLNQDVPIWLLGANKALNVVLSASTDLAGYLIYGILDSVSDAQGIYYSLVNVAVTAAAGATTELVAAPGAGLKIELFGLNVSPDVAGTMVLKSATTALTGTINLAAGTPYQIDLNPSVSNLQCAANEALNVTTVTCALTGWLTYAITAV